MILNIDTMIPAPTERTMPQRQLACARCGTAFKCGTGGSDGACWCMDEAYRVPMPMDASDCMCPECLRTTARRAELSA